MRSLTYTILKDKKQINPKTRQWAGMQFEDNATEVVFDLSELSIERALYRIDFNSAGAGYQPSENLSVENNIIKRAIPSYVTQYGGEVQVTAVITVIDENEVATGTCLSYPVLVYFTDVDKDAEGSKVAEKNISEAEASALDAANRAEKAAQSANSSEEAAQEAREKTEAARRALEEDSVFVFSGGDAKGGGKVEFVVDDELNPSSNNAVSNAAVCEGIVEITNTVNTNKQSSDKDLKELRENKEETANKVTSVNPGSTDEQYPSAKCLYDNLNNIDNSLKSTDDRLKKQETQKALWSGVSQMLEIDTIELSELISEQADGIELVFQAFDGTTARASDINTFRISKKSVEEINGRGRSFVCSTSAFGTVALKYIYIYDDKLLGFEKNSDVATANSGIKYTNNYFVLTKVYGV